MNAADITHDAWGILILVLLGGGAGLRILYGAFARFLEKVADRIVRAGDEWSARMREIVELLHEGEKAAVARHALTHEALSKLRAEIVRDVRDELLRMRSDVLHELRNVRIDLREHRAGDDDDSSVDLLSRSSETNPGATPEERERAARS